MFPFASIFYIDCNGDMWVPCCCGSNGNGGGDGSENGENGVETIGETSNQRISLDIVVRDGR